MMPSRKICPECGEPTVGLRPRLRAEFFGGYVVCRACSAYFHIDHKAWWFAALLLGCEGQLLLLLGAVLLSAALRWWSAPLIVFVFLALGYAVAAFSPLVRVEPTHDRNR